MKLGDIELMKAEHQQEMRRKLEEGERWSLPIACTRPAPSLPLPPSFSPFLPTLLAPLSLPSPPFPPP